jgi:4-amino-4-deoxy-L-arabinose transferase-like glycosyltransferase
VRRTARRDATWDALLLALDRAEGDGALSIGRAGPHPPQRRPALSARRWQLGGRAVLRAGPQLAVATVGLLLAAFATLSYRAVLTKSATYDETIHAVAGHVVRHHDDYRLDSEAPALFLRWADLGHPRGDLHIDGDDEDLREVGRDHARQWIVAVRALYETPGNDRGDAFINRSRAMFVPIAVALGALIAWWGWRLGGPVAGVATAALYCFDPNFLAHGALVANDVPLSLLMLVVAVGVWQLGRRTTAGSLALVAMGTGVALAVKFSAIVFGAFIALCLALRALSPRPWEVFGRAIVSRAARLGAACALCLVVAAASWLTVWSAYGFRFEEATDPSVGFERAPLLRETKRKELAVRAGGTPARPVTEKDIADWPDTATVRLVAFLEAHRLLPRAWIYGLWYTYETALTRGSYLMGAYSDTGWWYFFPLAMLFKTPTATLLAAAGALAMWAMPRARPRLAAWDAVCLLVPLGVYALNAMSANLNIGLRHVLPGYPFLFLLIALAAARLVEQRPRLGATIAAVLALALAAESLAAWPHYLAFFNVLAGGSRGGAELLADSNLDWGQDLPLLAEWRRRHADRPLFLSYFGMADPTVYGLAPRTDTPDGYPFPLGHPRAWPGRTPAYVAISATNLKGVYASDEVRRLYADVFGRKEPLAVLGGSIYIYDWRGDEAVIVSPPDVAR